MKEITMWRKLYPELKRHGVFQRLENLFGEGLPDVLYCIDNNTGLIELKQIQNKRLGRINYQPQQPIWFNEWIANGGELFILATWKRADGLFIFLIEWEAIVHYDNIYTLDELQNISAKSWSSRKGFSTDKWNEIAKDIAGILSKDGS